MHIEKQMKYSFDYNTKEPQTAHTSNLVPLITVGSRPYWQLKKNGRLGDIAPTILELFGLTQPAEMTGKSLLIT